MRRALIFMTAIALAACGTGVGVGDQVSTLPAPGETTTTAPGPTTTTSGGGASTTTVDGPTPTTQPGETTTTTTVPTTVSVAVYYLGEGGETPVRPGPFLIPVYREFARTPAMARTAVEELLEGPTADEAAAGITTAIPETLLLGITIEGGIANVNLSREFESGGGTFSMTARLAQVVYTLTQFDSVDGVLFSLDGEPVEVFSGEGIVLDGPATRDQYTDLLPTILVESPAWGAPVSSPMRMTGIAAAFEGTFQMELHDAEGVVIAHPDHVMNSNEGIGFPWTGFDVTITFDVSRQQVGSLVVWEYSAEDGSEQSIRQYPVLLLP